MLCRFPSPHCFKPQHPPIRNYIKGWFAIDLSSSIPFDFIPDVDDGGKARASKLIKAVRILRITKLLRLMRLSKLARYFRSYLIFLEEKVGLQFSDGGLQVGLPCVSLCRSLTLSPLSSSCSSALPSSLSSTGWAAW